jgi:hypothetical protein
MRDENAANEPEQSSEPPPPEHVEGEYPIDRLRQRLRSSLGGRPIMVYLVLVAGAATLLLLLIIVWYSATGGGNDESPLCTAISADDASQLILAGQVGRIDVLVDRDQPLDSLTLIVLRNNDGSCRQTAQGADVRDDLYRILGVVEIYNNFGDQRVRVHYQRQDVQSELLSTSTPTSLPTAIPTETPTLQPTISVSETVPPTPTATATLPLPLPASPTVVETETPNVTPAATFAS